jgi:hypothetical protein
MVQIYHLPPRTNVFLGIHDKHVGRESTTHTFGISKRDIHKLDSDWFIPSPVNTQIQGDKKLPNLFPWFEPEHGHASPSKANINPELQRKIRSHDAQLIRSTKAGHKIEYRPGGWMRREVDSDAYTTRPRRINTVNMDRRLQPVSTPAIWRAAIYRRGIHRRGDQPAAVGSEHSALRWKALHNCCMASGWNHKRMGPIHRSWWWSAISLDSVWGIKTILHICLTQIDSLHCASALREILRLRLKFYV